MLIKKFILILLLIISSMFINVNASINENGFGDHIGNGAGLSESNFSFAYHNMKTILTNLLLYNDVNLTNTELELTKKILNSLNDEYKSSNTLYFVEKEKFPFTLPECRNKVACTFGKVGSFIFINRSLVKYKEQGDEYIFLPEASSIIAHEFGHHHGIKNEQVLLNYGAKIRLSMSQGRDSMIQRWRKHPQIYSQYQNFKDLKKSFISINDQTSGVHLDLSDELSKNFKCPENSYEHIGSEISQMFWDKDITHRSWLVRFDITQYCEKGGVIKAYEAEQLFITPVFTYVDNRLSLTSFIPRYISCNYGDGTCFIK